jgi:hypothetical protein
LEPIYINLNTSFSKFWSLEQCFGV